ncbi:MAG: type 4a pilus biogenesis protein PilO [Firmicutes bacterium]|nr:type 4a pilus biogenesis protein PilO [Bacillota bacterium]
MAAIGKREKQLLLVLLVFGVVAGLYYGYDWYARIRREKVARRDALVREMNMVKEKVRDLAEVEEKLRQAEQLQEALQRMVPQEEEIPQLLRDLVTMLTSAGVELKSFQPGRPKNSPLPELSQIDVNISVNGTYRELLAMFDRLMKARRLIGVKNFSISGGKGIDPDLSCSVSLSVYCAKKS